MAYIDSPLNTAVCTKVVAESDTAVVYAQKYPAASDIRSRSSTSSLKDVMTTFVIIIDGLQSQFIRTHTEYMAL